MGDMGNRGDMGDRGDLGFRVDRGYRDAMGDMGDILQDVAWVTGGDRVT